MMATRRDFLRHAAAAGLGVVVHPVWKALAAGVPAWEGSALAAWPGGYPLGRVVINMLTAYSEPDWHATPNGYYYFDEVFNVNGAVEGAGLYGNNNVYLRTEKGFVYSSFVQPVRFQGNGVRNNVGDGFWAELTVPISDARYAPDPASYRRSRMYYTSVHRVVGIADGVDGQPWYKVSEEWFEYYLPAAHLRPIDPGEIGPMGGPDGKRIEVHIGAQTLTAFEGGNQVLHTIISTGVPGWDTPFGEYPIIDKRIGTRMSGAASDAMWNIPGVPFAMYITRSWIAIHGTFWHNDYGRRRSHGCINVTPEVAKWLFRWTSPNADYNAFSTWTANTGQPGTVVSIGW